jgi:hypothetical protein
MKKVLALCLLSLVLLSCQTEENELPIARTIQLADGSWELQAVRIAADLQIVSETDTQTVVLNESLQLAEDDCQHALAMKLYADGSGVFQFYGDYCGALERGNAGLRWQATDDFKEITFEGSSIAQAAYGSQAEINFLKVAVFQLAELNDEKLVLSQHIDFSEANYADFFEEGVISEDSSMLEIGGLLDLSLEYKKKR